MIIDNFPDVDIIIHCRFMPERRVAVDRKTWVVATSLPIGRVTILAMETETPDVYMSQRNDCNEIEKVTRRI